MGKVFKALAKSGIEKESEVQAEQQDNTVAEVEGESPEKKAEPAPREIIEESCPGNWDERLAALTGNYPDVLESFRRLRTRIIHPSEGMPARSILVVSASQAEGKSFVCANLGGIMAQGVDQYALIVDCDLRRPSMAGFFGRDNDKGLVNYLRDGVNLSSLIVQTGLKRLTLIPAGPPPGNPSELLSSARMTAMIDEVVNRYQDRFILLDSPPVQAASETAVLAQHVDGVILVVRWGGPGREQVKQLVDQIGKEKIIGVVFNAFKMTILDTGMKKEGYYKYYAEHY